MKNSRSYVPGVWAVAPVTHSNIGEFRSSSRGMTSDPKEPYFAG